MQIANLKLQNACLTKLSEAGKIEDEEMYFLTNLQTAQPTNHFPF